jgi:hypothetical protein
MTQQHLSFDAPPPHTITVDRGPLMEVEAPRLNRQCLEILARLKQGRASNRELSQIACKYTGRVSELRQAGHKVKVVSRDRENGLTFYELEE